MEDLTSDNNIRCYQAAVLLLVLTMKEPISNTYSDVEPVVSAAFHRSCKRWLTAQLVSLLPSAAFIPTRRCAQIPASPRLWDPRSAIFRVKIPD
jgi:hypothetical protein